MKNYTVKPIAGLLILMGSFATGFSQSQTLLSISDSLKTVTLKEVEVSAVKKASHQQLYEFFRANAGATLEETIGRLPEINLVRRGAFGMEPSIRNFRDGQINVLIDGMRIHGACTDKMDPATIYVEPINLEQIQLRTSSQGFLEGSSIGGTLNFRLAAPDTSRKKRLTGVFNSGYQTASQGFYESMALNYAIDKWAFRASGTFRKSSDYRSGSGKIISFSGFQKLNGTFGARYQISDQTSVRMDLLFDEGRNIGYAALPMDVGYAAAKIMSITLDHAAASRNKLAWQAKVYGNSIRHYMDDTHRPNVPMHMDMPGFSETLGVQSNGQLNLNDKQRLQFSFDVSRTHLRASMTMYEPNQLPMYMLTWPDNSKWQSGLGLNWMLKIDSLTQLQTNLRVDAINYRLLTSAAKDQVAVFGYPVGSLNKILGSTGVQLSRLLSRKWMSTMSVSFGERMPTAGELYGIYLFNSNDGFDYIGNPDLKVEKSLQAEVALNYSFRKNRFRLAMNYGQVYNFIKGVHDAGLSAMTIGANGVKRYVNIDRATVIAMELSSQWAIMKQMQWTNTLRYNYAKDAAGNPLPQIAPLKYIGALRYGLHQFSAGLEFEYAAKQNRIDRESGEDQTGFYALLHFRGGYQFYIRNVRSEIQLGCENIFDRVYHEHLDWGNIPRPGRNVYVTYKLVF